MRRRVTYRPSKAQGIFGAAAGGIFVLIGLFVAVPTFGPFGVLWTLMAVGITGMNLYQAFGKNYAGPQIEIEEERSSFRSPAGEADPSFTPDAKARLEQLESLKEAGLITGEEYLQKRREILREL